MSERAHTNTNPNEVDPLRLQAQGPIGFIHAVYQTLKRFGRPYYYGASVPPWFLSTDRGTDPMAQVDQQAFEEALNGLHPEVEDEVLAGRAPHAVIHQYRVFPSKRRGTINGASAGGARRQKTPSDVYYTDRPFPESEGVDDPDGKIKADLIPALKSTGRRPPLWNDSSQVPDLIREHVQENTVCYVTPWEYDVFVDFTLVATNAWDLEAMHRDFMLILRTFFDRSQTGASNLAGWFYESMSGSPGDIDQKLDGRFPSRTITWRLKQVEAYAFPSKLVSEINLELHGE